MRSKRQCGPHLGSPQGSLTGSKACLPLAAPKTSEAFSLETLAPWGTGALLSSHPLLSFPLFSASKRPQQEVRLGSPCTLPRKGECFVRGNLPPQSNDTSSRRKPCFCSSESSDGTLKTPRLPRLPRSLPMWSKFHNLPEYQSHHPYHGNSHHMHPLGTAL